MTALPHDNTHLIQGTPEWRALRKTKITATDASVILGTNPWKSKQTLYKEKFSSEDNVFINEAMKRGNDLEPIARELFILKTGIYVEPMVVIKGWAMASLDGISPCGKHILEIKCPNEKGQELAIKGIVPDYYFAQLQHQMFVCDVDFVHYFSFDGSDGILITVAKDDAFIKKMVEEELKFYECMINKIPPEFEVGDYVQREEQAWFETVDKYKRNKEMSQELEKEEEILKKQLIFLSGETNSKGGGLSLCNVERKGNIDYSKIPELKNVDLEKYRKAASSSWRITIS